MTCNSCKGKISDELSKLNEVKIVDIDVQQQRLLVELNRNSSSINEIQNTIESKLGLNTVIKGLGNSVAAVSEITGNFISFSDIYLNSNQISPPLGSEDVIGVIRFTQLLNKLCLVDGVIDGIKRHNNYSLNIHEFGDLSGEGFKRLGRVFLPILPSLTANTDSAHTSRAAFKTQVSNCELSSCIGRSLAVSLQDRVIAAGIVARASSVGDNSKKICACSGRSLWDERSIKQEDPTSRL